MKLFLQRTVQFLLLLAAISLLYISYINNSVKMLELYLVIHSLGLIYHLSFDRPKSRLFISVFSMFLLSSTAGVIYGHIMPKPDYLVYFIHAVSFLGLLLIFVEMLKRNPPRWVLNKYTIIIVAVIAIDIYFGYKIIELVDKYQLSLEHLFFGFIYTIFKMVLMSAGFIFYLTSGRKSRKISLLNWSFTAFFLSDIIDTLNSVIYMRDPIVAIIILQNGLLCIAMFFFYMYCMSPDVTEELEKERFI